MLLLRLTRAQAGAIAEEIRRATAAMQLPTGDGVASVSVSVGVAHADAAAGDLDLTGMLLRADPALYLAKRERNQVVVLEA